MTTAAHAHVPDALPSGPYRGGRRVLVISLAVGLAGLVLTAIGLLVDPRQALFSWLAAWGWAISVAIGALILLLIHHASGSRWFVTLRRPTEAVASPLPLLALLFIPIAAGMDTLYPWVGHPPEGTPEHVAHLLHHKRPYLNAPFWIIRALIYFLAFSGLWLFLRRGSREQDTELRVETAGRLRVAAIAGLPAVAFFETFGAFDWVMSLEPTWFSSAFGVYFWVGGFGAAIALVIITAAAVTARDPTIPIKPSHFYAIGRLQLAFVVFWAYIAYAQGFIIWIANKPEETTWYVLRTHGGWEIVAIVLALGHFVLPFAALLSRDLKLRPMRLAAVGAWLLFFHYVDMHWMVLPALHERFTVHWLDLTALAGVAGLSVAWGVWRLRAAPIVPGHAPGLAAALRYHA